MSQEGYLQIKIRDLNDAVEELKKEIEEKKKEIEGIKEQIEKILDKGVKAINPLIEANDKLDCINKHIERIIKEKMDNYFNEFQKTIFSQNEEFFDSFVRKFQKHFMEKFEGSLKIFSDNIMNAHGRIDNIIEILNERGYTNITSMKYDTRENSITEIKNKVVSDLIKALKSSYQHGTNTK